MTEEPYVGEFRWQGEPNNSLIEMWNGEEWVLATSEPTDKELCEFYRSAYYACENRQGPAAQAYALRAVLERWGRQ